MVRTFFRTSTEQQLIRDVVYAVAAVGMGNSHDEYPAQHAKIAEWRMNKQT